jgi:hypothetical protein
VEKSSSAISLMGEKQKSKAKSKNSFSGGYPFGFLWDF